MYYLLCLVDNEWTKSSASLSQVMCDMALMSSPKKGNFLSNVWCISFSQWQPKCKLL